MTEEILTIIPRLGSTATVSLSMTFSEKVYSLSFTTKEALINLPAVALLLQDSWHSPQSPTLLSLASPTSNFGRVQIACCLGSVAKLLGDHESEQRRPYDKYGIKMTGLCRKICGPSQKKLPNITGPPRLLHVISALAPHSPQGVNPCHFHCRLCSWCHLVEEQHLTASAPPASAGSRSSKSVNSKWAWDDLICGKQDITWVWGGNLAELQNNTRKGQWALTTKISNLTCHYVVKTLCAVFSTNGTANCDQLVTCRVDGVITGSEEKWSKTKTMELISHHRATLEVTSFQ